MTPTESTSHRTVCNLLVTGWIRVGRLQAFVLAGFINCGLLSGMIITIANECLEPVLFLWCVLFIQWSQFHTNLSCDSWTAWPHVSFLTWQLARGVWGKIWGTFCTALFVFNFLIITTWGLSKHSYTSLMRMIQFCCLNYTLKLNIFVSSFYTFYGAPIA